MRTDQHNMATRNLAQAPECRSVLSIVRLGLTTMRCPYTWQVQMCEVGLGASSAARDLFLQMETETHQRAAWEHTSKEAKAQKQFAVKRRIERRHQAAQSHRKRSPRRQTLVIHGVGEGETGHEPTRSARRIASPDAFCHISPEVRNTMQLTQAYLRPTHCAVGTMQAGL
jgi:hypothetical protein